MKRFEIRKNGTDELLFSGEYNNLKSCIEDAVRQNITLDYADLKGANLNNAEMDDGSFRYARFDQANLSGANMSAARFDGAVFRGSSLYNACLCESSLTKCQFFEAGFGATDLAWTDISEAAFDGLSALTLNFTDVLHMDQARYYDSTGSICTMSRPPLVIGGLQYPVALFDDHLKVGNAVLPYVSWLRMDKGRIRESFGQDIVEFMAVYQNLLMELVRKRANQHMSTASRHVA